MKADDRRELIGYLQRYEGLSKAAALADVKTATEASLKRSLDAYRQKVRSDASRAASAPAAVLDLASVADVGERPKKTPYTLLMLPEHLEALKVIAARDGSSVSHHIRQAIRGYLKAYRL